MKLYCIYESGHLSQGSLDFDINDHVIDSEEMTLELASELIGKAPGVWSLVPFEFVSVQEDIDAD